MKSIKAILVGLAIAGITGHAMATFYGDPLIEREYASDFPATIGMAPGVFVVQSAVLPTGTLNDFATWDQVQPGGSPFASAGNTLTAYVLQPTTTPDQFTVVYSSSLFTVPAVASSQIVTFSAGSVPFMTLAGDLIAFYGQGVPVDVTGAGTSELVYPTPDAPTLDQTITLGSAGFPIYPQNRFYSFGADVTPVPESSTIIAGALLLLPSGMSILRILRKGRTA
jgi:hypothetical protein